MEVDADKVRMLAESAELRANGFHLEYQNYQKKADHAVAMCNWAEEGRLREVAAGKLNDFFYWSGKATSYRGIIAMAEMATIVDDELDAEPTCP